MTEFTDDEYQGFTTVYDDMWPGYRAEGIKASLVLTTATNIIPASSLSKGGPVFNKPIVFIHERRPKDDAERMESFNFLGSLADGQPAKFKFMGGRLVRSADGDWVVHGVGYFYIDIEGGKDRVTFRPPLTIRVADQMAQLDPCHIDPFESEVHLILSSADLEIYLTTWQASPVLDSDGKVPLPASTASAWSRVPRSFFSKTPRSAPAAAQGSDGGLPQPLSRRSFSIDTPGQPGAKPKSRQPSE
jgi:hypothetical protein